MNQESLPFSWHFFIGRIPVVVDPTFWLISALFAYTRSWELVVTWMVVCFVSILIHELGHAAAALSLGSKGAAIRLYAMGGLTYSDRQLSRWRDVLVSLAGPGAGFLFGGLMYGVHQVWPPTNHFANVVYSDLLWVNIVWGIVNLLPVPPLDGGHVLLGVLGPSRRRIGMMVGVITACAVVAFAVSITSIYLALLFGMMGYRCFREFQQTQDLKPLAPVLPHEPEPEALERGWKALRAGDELEADRLGRLALSGAKKEAEANAARDLLAWVALAGRNVRAALSHLEKVQPPEAARPLSLAMVYEAGGMAERALPHALAAVEKERTEAAAALAVRLLVAQKRLDEAERLSREFAWKAPATREARLADVAAARGEFGAAAALYATAFETGQRAEHAYEAARSHARAGQVERATEWLTRALAAGYDDLEALAQEPSLAQVRTAPEIAGRLARK
jgi:Zn-dependent protease